jgi:hypothetical protein
VSFLYSSTGARAPVPENAAPQGVQRSAEGRSIARRAKRLNIAFRPDQLTLRGTITLLHFFKKPSKLACQAPNTSKSPQQIQ